jgi:hypothetical protein
VQAPQLLQALLGSASAVLRGSFVDERLQGPAHPAPKPLKPRFPGGR